MTRTRLFASLCGLVFLLNLARIIFAPLLDVIIAEFTIGEATAGLLVTLTWVGSAAPRLPTGWLLTKVPRHVVVLSSGAILAAASAFAAMGTSIEHLMLGAFLMGIASGVYFVSANPFLSELFPERVGRIVGIHGAASQIAAVLAAPLVTVTVLVDWRLSLWLIAVGAAVITGYTWLAARRATLPNAGADDRSFVAGALSEWRVIVTGLAIVGVASFVWQGVFNFYELYMQSKGMSPRASSMLLTVVFAAGIPAFFVGGDLADRLPKVPYLLGVVGLFSVSLFVLTLTEGLIGLLTLSAVVGVVIHSLFPATDTFLLETLPDSTRGSAYAVFSSVWMLTQSLGSFVLGLFVEQGYSYDQLFQIGAVFLALTIVGLAILERAGRLPN
ncbi:MFS transporter [Natronorubrum sp. JWXQ-INN-674]|uniref:MFS transporter n=1 Tax=Natronorubrum halalkaliphilum TaxID=2691917 RepID=A0A6B0VT57_9EURY|nr:MFS transporter [Natronorubrum halalkaliphilum]MXV64267.1 MFS transporter [Natronorubrum halalkaliphilum]